MKKFNVVCMAALLACGPHCTSSLHAESTELTEHHNEIVDNDIDTVEQKTNDEAEVANFHDESNTTDKTNTTRSDINESVILDEDIMDDVQEIALEVSSNQVITNDMPVVVTTITQEEVIEEDNLDSMVNELVQAGVTEENLSTLENQPQWKLLLARIGSYAISMGVSCKELLANIYANLQTTLQNYWSNNKKA